MIFLFELLCDRDMWKQIKLVDKSIFPFHLHRRCHMLRPFDNWQWFVVELFIQKNPACILTIVGWIDPFWLTILQRSHVRWRESSRCWQYWQGVNYSWKSHFLLLEWSNVAGFGCNWTISSTGTIASSWGGKHTSLMVVSGFGSWYRTYSFTYAVDTSTWIFKERVKIFHMVPTQG